MALKNNPYVLSMLRYKRITSNITIKELGIVLGVAPEFLSEMEKGNKIPSDYLIYSLSDYFNMSEDILFEGFNKTPIFGDYYYKIKDREKLKNLIDRVALSELSEDSKQLLYDNVFEAHLRREFIGLLK